MPVVHPKRPSVILSHTPLASAILLALGSPAVSAQQPQAESAKVRLTGYIERELPVIRADDRRMRQILFNLLSNAVKFTPDGGRVDVSARLDASGAVIAVKDTGIGIAPEDHAAVFEEFKQVGSDYTKKAEGTGLGLALTKRFIELHGGTIRVDSAPGKGATFTFTLPIRHGQ